MTEEQTTQAEHNFKAGDRVVIKKLGCEGIVLDSRDSSGGTLYHVAYNDRRKWVSGEALSPAVPEGDADTETADEAENTDDAADAAADTAVGAEPPAADETETGTKAADDEADAPVAGEDDGTND